MSFFPSGSRSIALNFVIEGRNLRFQVTAKHNIGSSTGHVGRNGNHTRTTRLRDNLGFLLVVLRIQYFVVNTRLLEVSRELFRGFDRSGTDQNRCLLLDDAFGLIDDRLQFLLL